MLLKRPLRLVIAASAVLGLTLGITSCSDGTSSGGSSGSQADTVLNVGTSSGPIQRVFNPYLPTSAYDLGSRRMIYEPLVQVDKIKTNDYRPWLAKSWKWSEDNKTLTFQLRQGVKFTDGQPFTSKDVVFTYELLKKYPGLNLTGLDYASVKADGDYSVVMTFDQPSFVFFDRIAYLEIVPEHTWSKVSNPLTYNDPNPVGTGPFMLDSSSFTAESYLLKKNPGYWQTGKPMIGGLRFIAYKDNTAIQQALVQGDVDWASAYIANIDQTFTAKGPNFKHFWPVVGADGLITNNASYPFDDLQVRKAVSLAIDRNQVAKIANRPPATNPIGLPLPLFDSAIAPQYKNATYEYSKDKAKQTLEADGYAMGSDGYYAKNGKQLAFSITIPSAFTEQIAAAQILLAQMKGVGIKVDINGVAVEQINSLTSKGNYQATIGYPIDEQVLPYNLYDSWMNPKYAQPVGKEIPTFQNIERWKDDATSKYFADYISAATDAEREKAVAGLEGRFIEGIPWIVMTYYQTYGDWNEAKATGFPTDQNPYWAANVNPIVATTIQPAK
jgi:peptide/nickel transport system substrate-binding protein